MRVLGFGFGLVLDLYLRQFLVNHALVAGFIQPVQPRIEVPGHESALEGVPELGPCWVFLELVVVQVE